MKNTSYLTCCRDLRLWLLRISFSELLFSYACFFFTLFVEHADRILLSTTLAEYINAICFSLSESGSRTRDLGGRHAAAGGSCFGGCGFTYDAGVGQLYQHPSRCSPCPEPTPLPDDSPQVPACPYPPQRQMIPVRRCWTMTKRQR